MEKAKDTSTEDHQVADSEVEIRYQDENYERHHHDEDRVDYYHHHHEDEEENEDVGKVSFNWGIKPYINVLQYSEMGVAAGLSVVLAEISQDRSVFNLQFGMGGMSLRLVSPHLGSLVNDQALEFNGGLGYRRYLGPQKARIFLNYNLLFNAFFWTYRNPLISNVYDEWDNYLFTEKIINDGVFGITNELGLGWTVLQTRFFAIDLIGKLGGSFYWLETFESFENDIFRGDMRFGFETNVIFGQ